MRELESQGLAIFDQRAGERIDDGSDVAYDGRFDGGFLEGTVGIGRKRAFLQDEVLRIAKRLRTGDSAADETKVFGVPTEIFALDLGVVDSAVFAVPESVFGIEDGVMNLEVTGVLEGVFACQP